MSELRNSTSVPWSEELIRIVKHAEEQTQVYQARPNSVMLLKALVEIPNASTPILSKMGLNETSVVYAIANYKFPREDDNTSSMICARATQLANATREDEVGTKQLLFAILETENSNAAGIIRLFEVNFENIQRNLFSHAGSKVTGSRLLGNRTGIIEPKMPTQNDIDNGLAPVYHPRFEDNT